MLPSHIHRFIFLFGICTLGGAITIGEVPTSISEIILFANWILEGKFKEKWQIIRSNKLLWLLGSLFLLHLIGLSYTTEVQKGLDDIRIKIPLMLLPLVFFTSEPLTKKELRSLFYLFILGLLISCGWSLIYYYRHPGIDLRVASRYISHIRLGLLTDTGLCILIYLISDTDNVRMRIAFSAIILFLLFSIIKLSLITALVILIILVIGYSFLLGLRQSLKIQLASLLLVMLVVGGISAYLAKAWKEYNYVDTSPENVAKKKSLSGRDYYPVKETRHRENGFYISYNIQYQEIALEWPKRSHSPLYDNHGSGPHLAWTLIRYLSSKGLTKDSAGIHQLTDTDVRNIEKGITNYKNPTLPALSRRIKQFFWEYEDYQYDSNPSGNTMLMRFEFWKAATYIIKRNFLYGVGTGDAQKAFDKAYMRTNSSLAYEWRLRSHNQFLAIAVSFGIIGLILFLVYLVYPYYSLRKYLHPVYHAFFVVAVISFITEDTLETQTGVTFFAYFNTLFLWLAYSEKNKSGITISSQK